MAGYRLPGPIGSETNREKLDRGTTALRRTPQPGPIRSQASGNVRYQDFQHLLSSCPDAIQGLHEEN